MALHTYAGELYNLPYDVLIYRDGDKAVAVDSVGRELARSADHTSVIQTAIDLLIKGGTIYIKPALYIIDNTINITNNGIRIIGGTCWSGSEYITPLFTAIKLADNVNKNMVYVSGKKVTIENILLDGNKDNNSNCDGIVTSTSGDLDFRMKNVYVFNVARDGIVWKGDYGYAESVYVEYVGHHAWVVTGNKNVFVGIGAWQVPFGVGIYDYSVTGMNRYIGCFIYNTGTHGIWLQNGKGKTVVACTIYQAIWNGILMYGAQKSIIRDNVVYRPSYNNANYDGIRLESYGSINSVENIICGNQIWNDNNTYNAGINEVDENQDYNIICLNIIRDATTPIVNNGVNSIVANNITG